MLLPGKQRRSAGEQRRGHQSQPCEEEAEARDHAAPQRPPPQLATSVWADRPGEVSVGATQQEAEPAVALDEACEAAREGEGPNNCHAGPCATRYYRDTQFDISQTLLHTVPLTRLPGYYYSTLLAIPAAPLFTSESRWRLRYSFGLSLDPAVLRPSQGHIT